MRGKLHAIAETFVRETGNDLPRYTFVFPNHRAGLFFRKYLAQYISKPMFAPRVMTINECFAELSDLQVADQLTLLLRLYEEYQKLRSKAEGLDRFIYWGKMMLTDFSEIDNHWVTHVDALFASVKDWHTIEERFYYLSDNQRKALSRFWKEFHESDMRHPSGELHKQFLHTWDLLFLLYTNLRDSLKKDGLAYEGMLHRDVIEHWDEIPAERFQEQYVFLGFNALTTTERELMLRLQAAGKADFYFDYDSPYLNDPQNRASLFMEDNLRDFRSRYAISQTETYQDPEITLVKVSSTIGEVHEVHRILSNIIPKDCQDFTRTAVVLPDEQLLIPLLHVFPELVNQINVTMGYPLRATSLYMPVAYPERYPDMDVSTAADFITQMRTLLLKQLSKENTEGVYQLIKVLDRLDTALTNYPKIAFSVADMQQLLKMLTSEGTIPYAGEPLNGLQVMGVLETRALDFDNIIIADFNDDLYPGRSHSNSFVPYALRVGFNMPTIDRQNAIFAYNFYRMLSYAKHVWFITNTTADEQHSGEVSRYLHQLKWQYNVKIHEIVVTNQLVSPKQPDSEDIVKDQRIHQLEVLSASALSTYLSCPKKFYYQYIEQLREPEPDESISASDKTVGIVLHKIIEELYHPGQNITATTIDSLRQQVNDDTFWASLKPLEKLNGDLLAERVVRTYINNILLYDAAQVPFQFVAAEKKISVRLPEYNLLLKGTVDRIDTHGNITRIIDYKTGKSDTEFISMEDVFGVVAPAEEGGYALRKKGKSQILQTLLYCWILAEQYPNMVPHIYATRRLTDAETKTWVHWTNSDQAVVFDDKLKQEFANELHALVAEIKNPDIPFSPTCDSRDCKKCAFATLCER